MTFSLVLLAAMPAALAVPTGYSVSQVNNLLLVKTPWGTTTYIAPLGFDEIRSYTLEIPLGDFRSQVASQNSGPTGRPSGSAANPDGAAPATGPAAVSDVEGLIVEANRLYFLGNFYGSLQYVDEINRRQPGNIRGWTMKGSLMHSLGHKDLAKQAWKKALEIEPGNLEIQNLLKGAP